MQFQTRKSIKNARNGHHFNSTYWQTYKKTIPLIPKELFEIAFGMVLGDAIVAHGSHQAYLKVEQGYKQHTFVLHLFCLFRDYCFMESPGIRYQKEASHTIKSYWFKTFSHPSFTYLFDLFYKKSSGDKRYKKRITHSLIRKYLTPRGFAYWVMCDGSLQKDRKTLLLYTQGYTLQENLILSQELNEKFCLHSRVISHKKKYFVLEIPSMDSIFVVSLLKPYTIPYFMYKLPFSLH